MSKIKTIKICYPIHPYYCPNCKALYFSEVECNCQNLKEELSKEEKECLTTGVNSKYELGLI